MNKIAGLLVLVMTGCVPMVYADADTAADALTIDRAEVLAVDVPGADVAVIDTGDAVAVWITDRPEVDVPDGGAVEDAPVVADAALSDTGGDASLADAGGPAVDAPVVDTHASCGALQDRCGGVCRSLLVDPANCGACGRACPSPAGGTGVCNGGRCEVACPTGYADCGTGRGCQDVRSDRQHCGMCGRGCHETAQCQAGMCVGCAPLPNGDALYRCGMACVLLSEEPRNCGACGRNCEGQCRGGVCWN